jgi:hypothetical protein
MITAFWEKIRRRRKSKKISFWINEQMIVLDKSSVPRAHTDMPDTCRKLYNEARAIVKHSPKSAAALLRLVIYSLMKALGESGIHIDKDIQALVKRGLPKRLQHALEYCRLMGENGVAPGEVDLSVTSDMPLILFAVINLIVEDQISRPKRIEKTYNNLPTGAWEQDAQ